jgi:hypothetical protein
VGQVKGQDGEGIVSIAFHKCLYLPTECDEATPAQKNIKPIFKFAAFLYPIVRGIAPNFASTLKEVGLAMIISVLQGYDKPTLEVKDINLLAKRWTYS